MRSQLDGPDGTRRGWRLPVTCTGSLTLPAAVVTATGSAGASKSGWIHWPTGPFQLPDSHMVRRSESTAADGRPPLAHWVENAVRSDADEEAVTSLMPVYRATAWYLLQPGSV